MTRPLETEHPVGAERPLERRRPSARDRSAASATGSNWALRMRLLTRVTLAAALTVMAPGPASAAQDNPSRDLSERRERVHREAELAEGALVESSGQLARANRRLDAVTADLDAAEVAVRTARNRLSEARERNRGLRQLLLEAEERLERARVELASSAAATAVQRETVVDMVTANYQGADPQLVALSSYLVSATAEDLVRRTRANEAMLDRQARVYDELQDAQLLAEARADDVEEATDELARRQQEAATGVAELAEVREAAEGAAERLRAAVDARRKATRTAAGIRASDLAVLRRVQARDQAIQDRIRDLAQQSAAPRAPARIVEPGEGPLILPVDGVVTSPYGYRTHPIYKYWGLHDGVDYGAPCGAPLEAAAGGVVSDTYYSDVYGYRLFVDAGRIGGTAITLVYNHASGYGVAEGDRVSQGQVVGAVGDSGWSTGCHLHFTVLANGSPADPADWY